MVNWQSSTEIATDSEVLVKLTHSLLGLYAWEFLNSLDFEWSFISGQKRFRWPLIFYFLGRYLLLFALIAFTISVDTTQQLNCQALYTFIQLAGDGAVGMASINLSLRTIAVWSQNKYIVALLVTIILGHWALILQGVLLSAVWVPGEGCGITYTNTTILAATFIYSMCFDLVVMCLSAYKLMWAPRKLGAGTTTMTSKLIKMIFRDGLVFFFIAFLANLVATVFMVLNLNSVMSIIFNIPAATASTIVACRVVRRLSNFRLGGPEVFSSGQTSGAYRSNGGPARPAASGGAMSRNNPGIHVQMETFTRAEACDNDADIYRDVKRNTVYLESGRELDVDVAGLGFKDKTDDSLSTVDESMHAV